VMFKPAQVSENRDLWHPTVETAGR
jgi:hypothetical protein